MGPANAEMLVPRSTDSLAQLTKARVTRTSEASKAERQARQGTNTHTHTPARPGTGWSGTYHAGVRGLDSASPCRGCLCVTQGLPA